MRLTAFRFKFLLASLCLWALSHAAWADNGGGTKIELYGLKIGAPLKMPECPSLGAITQRCYIDYGIDADSNVANEDGVKPNTVGIVFPENGIPQYSQYAEFSLMRAFTYDGKLVALMINMEGKEATQQKVMNSLISKFGEFDFMETVSKKHHAERNYLGFAIGSIFTYKIFGDGTTISYGGKFLDSEGGYIQILAAGWGYE